jgi:uncharacterized protein (TIGR02145 family)
MKPIFLLVCAMCMALINSCNGEHSAISDGSNSIINDMSSNSSTSSSSVISEISSSTEFMSSSNQSSNSQLISSSTGRSSSSLSSSTLSSTTIISSSSINQNTMSSSNTTSAGSSSSQEQYWNLSISYGEIVDVRDNQTYRTTQIGDQIWMAQNLNYSVPNGSYCYDNDEANCSIYGRLYSWNAVMGVDRSYNTTFLGDSINNRGICPERWHVPRLSEWNKLITYVASHSTSSTANALKSVSSLWKPYSKMTSTDDFGFSSLPSGIFKEGNQLFDYKGQFSYWWTANEYNSLFAYYKFIRYDYYVIQQYHMNNGKNDGFSLRCISN